MNVIRALQDVRLRGTDQQVGNELLARGAAMRYAATRNPDTGAQQPPVTVRGAMALTGYTLHNRSGGAATLGIGFKLRNDQWKAGQWTEVGSVYTDDTVDAQDDGASDFALEVAATNDDGFVILSSVKWDWLSLNVGLTNDASSTRAFRYSGATGSAWVASPSNIFLDEITGTADNIATGENLLVWTPPQDWGKTLGLTGISDGWYAFNCRSTTAPATTAALATAIEIGTLVNVVENVADNSTVSEEICDYWEPFGDAIVAFFSTANGGNRVAAQWRHAG